MISKKEKGGMPERYSPQTGDLTSLGIIYRYKLAGKRLKGKIADIGAGYSLAPQYFQDLTIIDYDKDVVQESLAKFPHVKAIICSAEEIPVENATFDCLIMFEIIEHMNKPEKVLKEANRILKRGGHLYLSTPNRFLPEFLVKMGLIPKQNNPHHVYEFVPKELIKLCNDAGFIVEENSGITQVRPGLLPGCLERGPLAKLLLHAGRLMPSIATETILLLRK